jgi:hypothetical protein
MNAHAPCRGRRRLAPVRALVLAAALGFGAGSTALAQPLAPATAAPPAAIAHRPFAGWQSTFGSRTRIIQVATVALIVGIFILTRGRWR